MSTTALIYNPFTNNLDYIGSSGSSSIPTVLVSTWTIVSGASVAAVAGNGYILTNAGTTTVTLPANASTKLGDAFALIALSGPFTISQAALQQIALGKSQSSVGASGTLSWGISNGYAAIVLRNTTATGSLGTFLWVVDTGPVGTFTLA